MCNRFLRDFPMKARLSVFWGMQNFLMACRVVQIMAAVEAHRTVCLLKKNLYIWFNYYFLRWHMSKGNIKPIIDTLKTLQINRQWPKRSELGSSVSGRRLMSALVIPNVAIRNQLPYKKRPGRLFSRTSEKRGRLFGAGVYFGWALIFLTRWTAAMEKDLLIF